MKLVEYFYKSIVFSLILNIIVFYTFAGSGGKNKNGDKKKCCCSGVNKNKDTKQNGEKDNNEDEQNEDGKKADPYEPKKKELIDRLNNLDAENKKLNSPIEQDIDVLKNGINAIKSNDNVTLIEFNLSQFETLINNNKEKEEAENEKIKKIKEKNEKLKNALNGLIKSGGYENMKYDELKKSLAKIKEDNYKDGFSEANIDADNKNLMTQIDKHIIATRAKEIDEEVKKKTEKELRSEITNSLTKIKDNVENKNSSGMQDSLNIILMVPAYKTLLKNNEIQKLVEEIQKIIESKNKEEEAAKKKKEEEEAKRKKEKEIEEKNEQLNQSLVALTKIDNYESIKSDVLKNMLTDIKNNYYKDGFSEANLNGDNKDLIKKIEKDISNKDKEEQEIEKKNNNLYKKLKFLINLGNYEYMKSTALENHLKLYLNNYKDDFINNNLNEDNDKLIKTIRKHIADNRKKEEELKEGYSFDCTNAMYLTVYIYEGTDQAEFEIFLKNNGKKTWASDSKIKIDPSSSLKINDIDLKQQKSNEERRYKVVIKNLGEKTIGEYKIFFLFYTNKNIIGDKITAMVKIKEKDNEKSEMEENMDKILEFRDTFNLSEDDYSNEKIFEILKDNDFNFENAFSALFN